MASVQDFQLAAAAAGFTLGFGFLTVWEAIKQTLANKSPLRSVYIYMVWGEIVANLAIGILGWLFLSGKLGPTVLVLFFILFLWVFEIQLLMQIIINRIWIIAENKEFVKKLKIGTAIIITMINIAVFCIWIPAHLDPPVSHTYVLINKYWDRTSKVLICIVDAGLNYYFLRTVRVRLVKHLGLIKYSPLVSFNMKLMIVSIAMDVMLIGLMSLPNQVVYVQFHPVAYMVKLNIEMSMASLISRLARGSIDNDMPFTADTQSQYHTHNRPANMDIERSHPNSKVSFELCAYKVPASDDMYLTNGDLGAKVVSVTEKKGILGSVSNRDIVRHTDFHVVAEALDNESGTKSLESGCSVSAKGQGRMEDDELPLQGTTAVTRKISSCGFHKDRLSKDKVHF